MSRKLDTANLDNAARDYAGQFLMPSIPSRRDPSKFIGGREWVMQCLCNATFKDAFGYLVTGIKQQFGPAPLMEFEKLAKELFTPRSDKVLAELLEKKLAITPDGVHIPGKIGTTDIGGRHVGHFLVEVETPDSVARRRRLGLPKSPEHRDVMMVMAKHKWRIYAGEEEERAAESGVADEFPVSSLVPIMALDTRISNNLAKAAADAGVDLVDEGTQGVVLEGRTTPRPADPDTAVTGTLLFALNSDDATTFTAATDGAPGGLKTAGTIDDDTSADATGTLLYIRASSANALDTPLNDHIDGECGTSGADFNFNTLAIVAGATVSLTSWTVTMPEA